MSNMQRRSLGQTNIEITPIGLGVMQFAGGKGIFRFAFPPMTQAAMNAIVQTAWEGGINWFDTAETYGKGWSEQGLARGLQAAGIDDGEVVVATKWWPVLRTAGNIRRTIADRQHFLAGYTIDLYQVHQPFSFSSPEAEMNAMADLVDAGKIRSVGVSNFSARQMRRAQRALAGRGYPLASNQVHYNLLHRGIERNGILDTAKELGITIIAWSPLSSGLLTGKFHQTPELLARTPRGRRLNLRRQIERSRPLIDLLTEIAPAYDATIAQVALNWLVHFHGDVVVAIPGASKVQHAAEAAATMRFQLSAADMQRIDEATRPPM
ncbi:MAG: aldo/keto reductase [Chloroflexi bacterium]|nr:aldo/keto reductase [Chloroflexota bacterium]